jgi:putative hydrolase of the HAD superfamily
VRDGSESAVAGVVLFDLDNTLADREAAFRRWAESFAVEHHLDASCVEFLCAGDGDGYVPRDALFTSVRERYGVTTSVEELVTRYRADYPTHFEPEAGVRAALTALRADGWRIGIVTNGPTSQNAKIASLGLDDLVDGICVSDDVGVDKPDRRIFELTAARCRAPLDGWMVGDSADTDIVGGVAAGLRTVWLHHGRVWDRPDLAPDAVVATVADAVRLITRRP